MSRVFMGHLACSLLLLVAASTARAGEAIVLSVEVADDEALTAGEVRDAVEREVGGTMLRARGTDEATPHDLLIIDVDGGRASMLFRTRAGQTRQRSVDLPPSRADGLRLIAWVAQNLVRDQTQAVLPPELERRDSEASAAGLAPLPSAPAVPDPLSSADSAEARDRRREAFLRDLDSGVFDRPCSVREGRPNPFADPSYAGFTAQAPASGRPNPFADPSPHPVVSQRRREVDRSAPRLSLAAFFGATQEWGTSDEYPFAQTREGELLQIEAEYSLGKVGFGVAFDVWGQDMERKATALFAAREWQWRRLRLGGNLGFGVAGSDGLMPYARVNAALGVMVVSRFELSLRFSLQAGPWDAETGQLAYLLGARFFL